MFTDGYFSISFPEVLGLIVTVLGIWFVVQQLREAKLANQMEGLISLIEIEEESSQQTREIRDLVEQDDGRS